MKLSFATPFVDALAAWRRDGAVLLPLAGVTIFVPQLAVQLLVPRMPPMPAGEPGEAQVAAWGEALSAWAGSYGIWYLLAPLIALYGALAIMALYANSDRPPLGQAMRRAFRLLPRYVLASILVSLPMGALLSLALATPVLTVVFLAPIFYVFGRTMVMGPALLAEAPLSAVGAIGRSWRMTRGNGLVLGAVYAAAMLFPALIGSWMLALGEGGLGANPVIFALGATLAALFATAGAIALALAEVAAYRRLANIGT